MFQKSLSFFTLPQKWQDNAVRGAFFKIMSCLAFAGIYSCVRHLSLMSKELGTIPISAPEIAFFQTIFGLFFLLPWVLKRGPSAFFMTKPSLYLARAIFLALGMIFWFMALAKMPMIHVISFKYTTPVFTLLAAKIFLKETCGWGRGLSILAAFLGALLIVGHEFFSGTLELAELSFLVALPLGATICHAIVAVLGKKQAKNDSPQTISLYLIVLTMPILGAASMFDWVQPDLWQWPWFVTMGGLLACGYMFLSYAYVGADIIYLIPASFTRLAAATILGILFFNEWPSSWAWLGILLISGATIALCQYESQKEKLRNILVPEVAA